MQDDWSGYSMTIARVRPDKHDSKLKSMNQISVNEEKAQLVLADDGFKNVTLDSVFGQKVSQLDIYDKSIKPFMGLVNDGENVCILCAGESGSGKTFTLYGNESSNGIVELSIRSIFEQLQQEPVGLSVVVSIVIYEIVQDSLRDLIDPLNKNISINSLNSLFGCTTQQGLKELQIKDWNETKVVIDKSLKNRSLVNNSTGGFMSSRSHVILEVNISIFFFLNI
eukprot:c15691_g1_i2.p1 GENE.c15691_g1_i2~~c15691_g1_i2.p1  ORF type:complete len:224 (+),score=80.34 c15691_g1_i2:47-718(+)